MVERRFCKAMVRGSIPHSRPLNNIMNLPINYDDSHWAVRRDARNEYIRRQGGNCFYCDEPLDGKPINSVMQASINKSLFPPTMFKYPIHLHHDRETGMTIGAVHARCNAYLWQYHGE